MKNWKTTVFGLLGVSMALLAEPMKQLAAGQPVDWLKIAGALALALMAYFAKDYNVSGSGK